jgi:hypothetical protein
LAARQVLELDNNPRGAWAGRGAEQARGRGSARRRVPIVQAAGHLLGLWSSLSHGGLLRNAARAWPMRGAIGRPALSPPPRVERNRVEVQRRESGGNVHVERAPGDAGRIEDETVQRYRLKWAFGTSLLARAQEQRAPRRKNIDARRIWAPPSLLGLGHSRSEACKHGKGGNGRTTHGDGLKQNPGIG